ncbi:MAG: ABC transporter substrate-binding protein [Dehalococcoidia bacterium]|nr:MAG: ABC transporter substrate-binding protein [Dehalococcoidia bacterium]
MPHHDPSQRQRRGRGALPLLLLVLALACAPVEAVPAPGPAPDVPQVLRVATSVLPPSVTPAASTSAHFILWTIYDSVTQLGPAFQPQPWGAERWELAPDGLSWTVTLRSDLRWPDGLTVTAEDVAFSFAQARLRRWPASALLTSVEQVRVLGSFQVVFTLRHVDLAVPNSLAYLWLIPKHVVEQLGFDEFVRQPMGSGPYEVAAFQPGVALVVRKRQPSAGPLHAFRRPIADEIAFLAMTDPTEKLAALLEGQVEVAAVQSFTLAQLDRLQGAGMVVRALPLATLAFAFPEGTLAARASPLRDRRVRLALNYAVNKAALAARFPGAEPVGQFAFPWSEFWDPAASPLPYDPERARALLAEAGYPNGLRLETGIDYQPAIIPTDVALAVQRDLAAVGVESELVPLASAAYQDRAFGRGSQPKAELFGAATVDATGFANGIRAVLGCDRPLGADLIARWYCNPAWDQLVDQALRERVPEQRRALLRAASQLQRDDLPFLYLILQPAYTVHVPSVRIGGLFHLRNFHLDGAYRLR